MTDQELFDKIFKFPDLITSPPVLLDIGASGNLHNNWQSIARYAICIAFDADDREMDFINDKAKNFRQLHIVNKIVSDKNIETADFYLTSSPYCSSLLQPDSECLADWYFGDNFNIEKKISLPAISLQKALADLAIDYVDWFKSDSQGLDLKLFKNIEQKQYNAIIADFEPGFIDAYRGEDKIKDLLDYMDTMPFWLCAFAVGGNKRMNISKLTPTFSSTEIDRIRYTTSDAAIFSEVTYINNFKQPQLQTERYYLLGCVFSLILKQYGFAAELAIHGLNLTGNSLFSEILDYIKQVSRKPTIAMLIANPALLKKKILNRMIYRLQNLL
ncbi:hypothetical protein [Mucilaginibacter sp.]|uniref:hypothetical protein n=1 Tax=Mucilaginibacter sp. TaxID=1882438 RepID=UPI00283E1EB2|nr:hypothetical protein [Mucilaginibacter sp.]MDR3695454.1 hypothetical protein [Mucilaginibacter sp.]